MRGTADIASSNRIADTDASFMSYNPRPGTVVRSADAVPKHTNREAILVRHACLMDGVANDGSLAEPSI